MTDDKAALIDSLHALNQAVLVKLDGVGEYDLRRPMTPTGTNLLGLVKHLASVQAGYFGDVFGQPWPETLTWMGPDAEPNADMFAESDESLEWVRDFYVRSWEHAATTFDLVGPEDTGTVSWWPPERRHPTLNTVLLHMIVETARHAGHMDILREAVDGQAGRFEGDPSVLDSFEWAGYIDRLEEIARSFDGS